MKSITIILIILTLSLIGLIIFGSFRTGRVVEDVEGDVFEGVITNVKLEPGILDGTGVYDKSCNMIGNGLTQCDAGIQTEKDLLNFNYKHNMAVQPCIAEGDNLKIEILEGGKAKVTRL